MFIVQSDADILSQMSDSVRMVQCARDVMDLIAEIGSSLEYVTIISVYLFLTSSRV